MKFLIALLMVVSIPAFATLETQQRCFVDTNTTVNATGAGAKLVVASANRACLFISNKSTSLKVYMSGIASTNVGDGIELPVTSTFNPAVVPTGDLYFHTTGGAASLGIMSGYLIQ